MIIPRPTEDEAAAILAAIATYLTEQEGHGTHPSDDWQWSAAAALQPHGVPFQRSPVPPSWNRVERLRRAGQGGLGITGL